MDKYTLNVVTLLDTNLEEQFQKIQDPDRLTTVFHRGDIENPETYCSADVIFLSHQQAEEKINIVLENISSYTHLVLLLDDTETVAEKFIQYEMWDLAGRTILNDIFALKRKMRTSFDLELKENQLYTLIDSVPDLIWYKDIDGLHIDVNEPFCQSVDQTRKEIKYKNQGEIMGLTAEEFANGEFACVTTDNFVIKDQKTSLFDEKVLMHGEMRQFKTYKTALRGRKGETIGTVGMAHDVTDIWNTHEEFRIVISRLPFPMMILDKNYGLLSCNSKFDEYFHDDVESQGDFNITDFGQKYFNCDITLIENNNSTLDHKVINNGKEYHILIEKSEITDVFGELSGYFYIFRDFTKTYEYEEQLRMMVETDELTQIYNRKFVREFFDTKLRVFVKEKLSFSISIIDIDYFKNYNDHYGHVEGDMAIKEIANVLKSHSDNEKVFVARFGGEEFIVMTIDKKQGEVKGLLASMQKELKLAQIPHEKSVVSDVLTMSIGCYYLDVLENEMHLADLVEIADKYLYDAKEQGRNRVVSNIPGNIPEISFDYQQKENLDVLTNTLNERGMKEATSSILTQSDSEERHALFLVVLEDFKGVKEKFGAVFGEYILVQLGKRLSDSVRNHDLVGHVDDDKFGIFLRNVPNTEILMDKAKMFQSAITKEVSDGISSHSLNGSIGIAVYPEHGTTDEELYHHVDIALNHSVNNGKNRVTIFDQSLEGKQG
ncbi:MAG: diguanylate cyclase [Eubacteriales bacterium]